MAISVSTVMLQPGLYILRHPEQGMPALSVVPTPNSRGRVETLVANPAHGLALKSGADCIVMRVDDAPIELLIAAFWELQEQALTPSIRLDQIGLANTPVTSLPPAQGAIEIPAQGLSIIGHIEREGDKLVRAQELLGNPFANYRLEGFQINWPDRPEGLDIAYRVVIEGGSTLPFFSTGQFSGTRGAGKRIIEVTLVMTGPQADQYELDGFVYFSGGFKIPIIPGIRLSGPSGMEHLTALSVQATLKTTSPTNPWQDPHTTKVFKPNESIQPEKKRKKSKA